MCWIELSWFLGQLCQGKNDYENAGTFYGMFLATKKIIVQL